MAHSALQNYRFLKTREFLSLQLVCLDSAEPSESTPKSCNLSRLRPEEQSLILCRNELQKKTPWLTELGVASSDSPKQQQLVLDNLCSRSGPCVSAMRQPHLEESLHAQVDRLVYSRTLLYQVVIAVAVGNVLICWGAG